MKSTSKKAGLLQGAFILSAAALLSKLIGTLQKIPLQNLGGDAVFGIYNTVYPLYNLLLTAAMLGLPAAVSKAVAEAGAGKREDQGRRALRTAASLTAASGILLGLLLYLGAPAISGWIGSQHVTPALRMSAWGLAVVPLMAALRGYFQGLHDMLPTAVSQIVEQTVRVAVMIALLLALTSNGAGPETIAAGAMLGSAGGGLAGLFVMLLYWRSHKRRSAALAEAELAAGLAVPDLPYAGDTPGPAVAQPMDAPEAWRTDSRGTDSQAPEPGRERLMAPPARTGVRGLDSGRAGTLLAYGVPVMLGSLAVALIGLVDIFTVPRLLAGQAGGAEAMAQFGIYNRGLPLVQLVTMLATSLSVIFIPALADAKYRGDLAGIETKLTLSLRWFWLLGLAASAGLAVLAEPVNVALYGDALGTGAMRWLAFTAAGGTLSIISAALLQGLGSVRAPAVHLLAAALLKAALNLLLIPQQGITGAAVAGVAAHGLAAALNIALLRRQARLRLRPADVLGRPALLVAGLAAAAGAAAWAAAAALAGAGIGGGRTASLTETLLGVTAGCAVFAAGAVRLRLLGRDELLQLPGVGPKLERWMTRLRLLP